ncbi:hypothetical protein SGPA1_30263 [Streptomyces misionensis JCM 4497]
MIDHAPENRTRHPRRRPGGGHHADRRRDRPSRPGRPRQPARRTRLFARRHDRRLHRRARQDDVPRHLRRQLLRPRRGPGRLPGRPVGPLRPVPPGQPDARAAGRRPPLGRARRRPRLRGPRHRPGRHTAGRLRDRAVRPALLARRQDPRPAPRAVLPPRRPGRPRHRQRDVRGADPAARRPHPPRLHGGAARGRRRGPRPVPDLDPDRGRPLPARRPVRLPHRRRPRRPRGAGHARRPAARPGARLHRGRRQHRPPLPRRSAPRHRHPRHREPDRAAGRAADPQDPARRHRRLPLPRRHRQAAPAQPPPGQHRRHDRHRP